MQYSSKEIMGNSTSKEETGCANFRIAHRDGDVEVAELCGNRIRVKLLPHRPDLYIPRRDCETGFPLNLIELILEEYGYAWLCDVIARHEDPDHVNRLILRQLFAYFSPLEFVGKRLLDFGCGSGASSFSMASILPDTEIIGVDINQSALEIAEKIKSYRSLANVRFFNSATGVSLPRRLGSFDFVMLSAVYEHLLPAERKIVMPQIWSVMKAGAVLFVNATPHRYFPYEHHSTGLWFINYLPDRLTYLAARKFARHNRSVNKSRDWTEHLRGGIRGGTERGIIGDLSRGSDQKAEILQPSQEGLRNRADYWLSLVTPGRHRLSKRLLWYLFRLTDRSFDTLLTVNVDVAIRKGREPTSLEIVGL